MLITISYATPEKQVEIAITVADNCTVAQAIAFSKITDQFPKIKISDNSVGIFGKCVTLNTIVHDGDRVEIYRPLIMDPKEARRAKARNLKL
ncbi:MAG: hypothetical protein ACD_42C00532G0008 [uncultured bacterium]|nr:MAG: hypothetical protein ACD_42C00532G0008 [uncultured bacterium]OGT34392.1 MAG: hypothetical protein A3C44_05485 [Gammaproteobacteria bacterium RIFCSPHIGHO2_02_FULL_39_13]OGT50483.1 MAG: hypothetical protein A3E53_06730 [Gammaproteobacteria bacterium RIFCSPHIGHO2_12_FULL_39_24]